MADVIVAQMEAETSASDAYWIWISRTSPPRFNTNIMDKGEEQKRMETMLVPRPSKYLGRRDSLKVLWQRRGGKGEERENRKKEERRRNGAVFAFFRSCASKIDGFDDL
ncbi:unnamed protein product [Strongylus vulgaris]|uniref:Uncharacterized protein n=1 Tax=Strongylus vulgaris TaxID=40348 RepID=A0A3P7IEZ4_STRVU|nr:unnamed protein product [Strongylus vulgaris]